MTGNIYYDRQGKPITTARWAELHNPEYIRVASDTVGDMEVSTVWLGINHNFTGGRPVIFETMIFGGERDQDCWRYATEKEALDGHTHIVNQLRSQA